MKNPIICTFLILLLFSCSKSSKDQKNTESAESTEVEISEPEMPTTSELLSHPVLKEQLFFYIRHQIVDVDEYTFVKYENLTLDGKSFKYLAVIADQDLLRPTASKSIELIHLASYRSNQLSNHEVGDTISITGTMEFIEVTSQVEADPTLTIRLEGRVVTSYLSASPYSYSGYERRDDAYDLMEELVVKLSEPKNYNKGQLYLKARIALLSEEDLKGFSIDEFAFLRNELFARHGHTFNTKKMQDYFMGQGWYRPYFSDVTPFLNEIEKENAQFIKSLES